MRPVCENCYPRFHSRGGRDVVSGFSRLIYNLPSALSAASQQGSCWVTVRIVGGLCRMIAGQYRFHFSWRVSGGHSATFTPQPLHPCRPVTMDMCRPVTCMDTGVAVVILCPPLPRSVASYDSALTDTESNASSSSLGSDKAPGLINTTFLPVWLCM